MLLSYVKRGAYHTTFYTASSFLVRFVGFACMPWFVSRVSLQDFGIWDYYQLYFQLGIIVLSSCSALSMTRFYFTYADDPQKQKQVIGNASLFLLLCTALLLLVFFLGNHQSEKFAFITTINICFFSLFNFLLAYVRIREKVWPYLYLFVGQGVLAIILTMIGVAYGYAIDAYFYANGISYFIFLPGFIYLVSRSYAFSLPLFKQQLLYGLPLAFHTLLYHVFFCVDRFIIKQTAGFELLGLYSLLWRFGTLFQFFAISLLDAWPIIILNAEKEEKSSELLTKLTTYCCLALVTASLGVIVFARCILGYAFCFKYQCLIQYLPLYFLPMAFLELARIIQGASVLSGKTRTMPLLSLCAVFVQIAGIYAFRSCGLWGVFFGNLVAFSVYLGLSALYSSRLYHTKIIDSPKIFKIIMLFLIFMLFMHYTCCYADWYYSVFVFLCWPLVLWFSGVIDEHEKAWLTKKRCAINLLRMQ